MAEKINILEETRKVDLLQVVRDLGIELQNHRKICCPFHEEKTPSLVLYPQTNTYHCFGCGQHGDVIHFYAGVTHTDYTKAMHALAFQYVPGYDRRGAALPTLPSRPEIAADQLPDTKLYRFDPIHTEIYETFKQFCDDRADTPASVEAYDYLKSRGFSEYTLRTFGIFTLKDYHEASYYLRSVYSIADLRESGLFNERDNLVFYRHTILIPYYQKGRIVFLQGRVVGSPTDRTPRYQFLSGVPIPLYNSDILPKLKTGQTLYLTEGAFDCMTLVQQGLAAVSLGSVTLFKNEWAKLFRRFDICLWLDNDPAGQQASKMLRKLFLEAGISATVQHPKEGFKDINDYYRGREDGLFLS
jgi:DNA primase